MLVATALVALQLAVASPSQLVVRNATRTLRVPLVATADGPVLRPESLAPVLAVTLQHDSGTAWTITVAGVVLRVETGQRTVRAGEAVRQLASPVVERDRHLYVPLQLVSEVLPGTVPNVRWDADSAQLVVFSSVDRYAARPVRRSTRRGAGETAVAVATPVLRREDGHGSSRPERPGVTAEPRRASARRLVIVDAGHGGPDRGMSGVATDGSRIYEKNITLAVSKRLGQELESRGLAVLFTRTTDTLIALSDRGRIANQASGDLFISIHVNAANPHWEHPAASRGYETYFLAEARTEDARRVESMENESVRFETAPSVSRDDPLGFILTDMQQNEHLRESAELADIIQRRLGEIHPGPSRGVKQAGFRVLVTAFMPAVLVEIGFGTNPAEATFISDPGHQDEIANAIADAAVDYLERYQRRVTGGSGSSGKGGR